VDDIVKKLPALKKGNFMMLSPDEFETARDFNVRWLVTKHTVLGEDQLSDFVSDELREKYSRKPAVEEVQETQEAAAEESFESEAVEAEKNIKPDGEEVFYVKTDVFETDILKAVKPLLSGTLIKSEKLLESTFRYLPLIKVNLIFFKEKGVFKKKITEIPENLYLDYKTRKVFYFDGKQPKFSQVVDADPNQICDIDDICTIDIIKKSEIDFDFRKTGKKIDRVEIKNLMERKYRVEVNDVDLLLYPTWECRLGEKKTDAIRTVVIDGISGKEIVY